MVQNNFIRISISGDPGSGKTTFARTVAEETGFRLITTGNIFRQLAAAKSMSLTALNELAQNKAEIDRQVDDYLVSLNENQENLVLDSRMAWHFVQPSFKIRLTVRPEIAAARIFADDAALREEFTTIEQAVDEVERRRASEILRYKTFYNVDIGDHKNYNLVIDSSDISPQEVLEQFHQAFELYKKNQ
jgi:cytidylate kinase